MKIPYLPDEYDWKARAIPVFLVVVPVIAAIWLLPIPFDPIPSGIVVTLISSSGVYLAAVMGGLPGKRIEKGLWEKQGGRPTVRFLQHGNNEFNRFTRQRIHAKLIDLGLDVPSANQEEEEPKTAIAKWESCVEALIQKTRDKNRFPLVFNNLTAYGFHRNLLGIKYIGVLVAGAVVAVSAWTTIAEPFQNTGTFGPISAILIAGVMMVVWATMATPRSLIRSDERYARSLLEAALQLD